MADGPRLKALKAILFKYDVHICEASELDVLTEYDIVCVADDSYSMHERLASGGTRWAEQKDTLERIIEVACCFDSDGIDVYWLNRGSIAGVTTAKDPRIFEKGPCGSTPLAETLSKMLEDKLGNKPLLVMISTDGLPNGGVKKVATVIRNSIKESQGRVRYQLLACSDRDEDIGWMNELDDEFDEVDCTDDYETERQEVLSVGLAKKFEKGDWVMKALLGPISKKFDAWDMGAHKSVARRAKPTSSALNTATAWGILLVIVCLLWSLFRR